MESLQKIHEEFSMNLFGMDITSMSRGKFEELALGGFKEYLMKHMSLVIRKQMTVLRTILSCARTGT